MQNQSFNLTSLIVLAAILIIGLLLINLFAYIEIKRKQKIVNNKFPSATRKFSKEVNDKLDIDIKKYNY